MKKGLKISFLVLGICVGIVFLDTFQAKVLNNRPLIRITENYKDGNIQKRDKGIFVYTYSFTNGEKVTVYRWQKYSPFREDSTNHGETTNSQTNENQKEQEKMKNISILINGKKYQVTMEDNETAQAFLNHLPQEFIMEELNENEKYIYMDFSLPTDSKNPKQIVAGDIMLYGNNCLVIFYQSFDTNYRYTKIGHIDDLPDLGRGNVTVQFEKIS